MWLTPLDGELWCWMGDEARGSKAGVRRGILGEVVSAISTDYLLGILLRSLYISQVWFMGMEALQGLVCS